MACRNGRSAIKNEPHGEVDRCTAVHDAPMALDRRERGGRPRSPMRVTMRPLACNHDAILENSLMRGDGEALFSRNGAEEKERLLQLVHEGFHRSAGSRGASLPRGNFCAVKMLPGGMISSFASISERFALSPRL
jgi:hypothetical protein